MFLFLGFIGSALLGIGKRVVGGHLLGGEALSAANGAEAAVTGLGARFFLGVGFALYWSNSDFRDAINGVLSVLKDIIL